MYQYLYSEAIQCCPQSQHDIQATNNDMSNACLMIKCLCYEKGREKEWIPFSADFTGEVACNHVKIPLDLRKCAKFTELHTSDFAHLKLHKIWQEQHTGLKLAGMTE